MKETKKLKLWGFVNLFLNSNDLTIAKGIANTVHTQTYGKLTTITQGSIFKPNDKTNWYFRDVENLNTSSDNLVIKVPKDTWLLYYKHSGEYYCRYGERWDIMLIQVLNELEYFDYVYHN